MIPADRCSFVNMFRIIESLSILLGLLCLSKGFSDGCITVGHVEEDSAAEPECVIFSSNRIVTSAWRAFRRCEIHDYPVCCTFLSCVIHRCIRLAKLA